MQKAYVVNDRPAPKAAIGLGIVTTTLCYGIGVGANWLTMNLQVLPLIILGTLLAGLASGWMRTKFVAMWRSFHSPERHLLSFYREHTPSADKRRTAGDRIRRLDCHHLLSKTFLFSNKYSWTSDLPITIRRSNLLYCALNSATILLVGAIFVVGLPGTMIYGLWRSAVCISAVLSGVYSYYLTYGVYNWDGWMLIILLGSIGLIVLVTLIDRLFWSGYLQRLWNGHLNPEYYIAVDDVRGVFD